MNETRKKVIDNSYKFINEFADKYKDEENNSIKEAIDAYYVDNDKDFDSATSFMTAAENHLLKKLLMLFILILVLIIVLVSKFKNYLE